VLEQMLAFGEVGPGDVLYDLGCGDGRIVARAAQRFGIQCVGVDLDPQRVREARANARRHGVEHLVQIVQQDAKTVDLSGATVVTLYLTFLGNTKLQRNLREQLQAGSRVVSLDYLIPGWPPERSQAVELQNSGRSVLHRWRIPSP
jgi:ubiquinone/menaquinone biosynthesis C-methylase UbiE